ncbi:MAG: hypothetical protein KAH86_04230 [Methanosarcinales archaeon]|nr:hypothetical protein [Methanosarcinales archaeon]
MIISSNIDETATAEATNKKIIGLLKGAKKSILMSTGLHPEFYGDEDVKTVMADAITRVKFTQIIITEKYESVPQNISWLFDLKNKLKDKIQIRYNECALHWLIIDDKNIRLERPHPSDVIGVNNFFDTNVPKDMVNVLKTHYEEWWNSAKSNE